MLACSADVGVQRRTTRAGGSGLARGRKIAQGSPLSEAEISAITLRLRSGEYLDDQYQDRLFRRPKEYELTYSGKETRGRVLESTMGVPIQTLRRFGDPTGDWTNRLVFGDNLQVLRTLFDLKERGELTNADGTPGVRVCYIDPPFATRQEFRGRQEERAYADKVVGAQFVEFLRKRLILIRELLSDDGTLWVHLDQRKVHYAKVVLDEIFGENSFLSEVIWSYGSSSGGRAAGNKLVRGHESLLVYARHHGRQKFNHLHLPYSGRYIKDWFKWDDNDGQGPYRKRWRRDADGESYSERQYLKQSPGMPLSTVWDDIQQLYADPRAYKPEQAEHTEITGYPTQKPMKLLERIIDVSSDPGDIVLDCFVGSGTSAEAADRKGRRWIAVDCGKFAIYTTQRRLVGTAVSPFELSTAGLYDNDLLERLSFEEFEAFCLDLFGCRAGAFTISAIPMAGLRKGAPVHFFPFEQTDAVMGVDYVASLHERLQGKVSGSVCVVAPVSRCDPGLFEDVIQLGEGRRQVSYFILRVPYSVIAALHEKGFEHISQPASEDEVNNALDAYGFDFIQLPEADVEIELDAQRLRVHVARFYRGGLDPDDFDSQPDHGRRELAMMMVDSDYDGELFRLSHWSFADQLAKGDWTLALPRNELGAQLMLVLVDAHGNELREIIAFRGSAVVRAASSSLTAPR